MKIMRAMLGVSGSLLACATATLFTASITTAPAEAQRGTSATQLAPATGSIDLRARFERDRPTVYEVDFITQNSFEIGEVTQEYTGTYRSRVAITLHTAGNNITTLKLTHERIAVTFEGRGGGPLPMGAYDSDNPDADTTTDEYRAIVAPMVNKPVLIDLTPNGEIAAVRGLAQMAPEGVAGQYFLVMFSEQTFRDMYGWLFALKAEPATAELGESWQIVQSDNNQLGTLRRVHALTLDSISGNTATVTIAGKNDLLGSAPGMFEVRPPASGAPMVKGTIAWDTEHRQVITLESTSNTRVESTMPGMSVKMNINAETKAKRVGE